MRHCRPKLLTRLAAIGLAGAMSAAPACAQESVGLGNGTNLTILDYLLETSAAGHKTIVVMAKPDFDPEPYGAVPSDEYLRTVEPLCAALLANSRDTLEAEGVGAVRFRWDFTPSYDTGASATITMSRFHEFVFAISDEWACIPKPLGVGLNNLAPDLPSGLAVTLRYAEQGPRLRQLTLTYETDERLADLTDERLENAAIELCILHADLILADRQRYYPQLESQIVSIGFLERDGRGGELEKRVVFEVEDHACQTGLSAMLVESIRLAAETDGERGD